MQSQSCGSTASIRSHRVAWNPLWTIAARGLAARRAVPAQAEAVAVDDRVAEVGVPAAHVNTPVS